MNIQIGSAERYDMMGLRLKQVKLKEWYMTFNIGSCQGQRHIKEKCNTFEEYKIKLSNQINEQKYQICCVVMPSNIK